MIKKDLIKEYYLNKAKTYYGTNKTTNSINQFYTEEENALRLRHKENFASISGAWPVVEERIKELEQLVSPYIDDEFKRSIPKNYPAIKSGVANIISKIKAAIYENIWFSVSLSPIDGDKESKLKVGKLKSVLYSEMEKSNSKSTIMEAIRTSRRNLFGVTLLSWVGKTGFGDNDNISTSPFKLVNISTRNFRWQPGKTKIEDSEYCYVLSSVTLQDIICDPILSKNQDILNFLMKDAKNIDISKFINNNKNDIKKLVDKSDRVNNTQQEENITLYARFWLKNYKKPNQECMVSYFIGDDILLTTEKTGSKIIPISILYENKHEDDFYGDCTIYQLSTRIKQLDVLLSTIKYNNTQSTKSLLLLNEDLGVNIRNLLKDWKRNTSGIIPIQAGGGAILNNSIQLLNPIAHNQDLQDQYERELRDIYSIAGISRLLEGTTNSLMSGSGVNSSLATSLTADDAGKNFFKNYILRIYTIVLEFLIKKYNGIEKQAKIRIDDPDPSNIAPDGSNYKFIDIKPGEFQNIQADIVPTFQEAPSLSKQQNLDVLLKLLALESQEKNPENKTILSDPAVRASLLMKFLPGGQFLQAKQAIKSVENLEKLTKAATSDLLTQLTQGDPNTPLSDVVGNTSNKLGQALQGASLEDIPSAEQDIEDQQAQMMQESPSMGGGLEGMPQELPQGMPEGILSEGMPEGEGEF